MMQSLSTGVLLAFWLSVVMAEPVYPVDESTTATSTSAEPRGYANYANQQGPYPSPYQNPAGGPTAFAAPVGTAYHAPPQSPAVEIIRVDIECHKTYMNVGIKFSRPFTGYIYPYGFFAKCILWVGRGETEIMLTLSRDICGAPVKVQGYSNLDPIIEHYLMIQWDTDLVQEYDTNVMVRCDRPDDYNRTIKFDFTSMVEEKRQAILKTHPGPKLSMEVQDGEGPAATPLLGPVYLGQPLSLVFRLEDDVFDFDSNVLNCWATDGRTEQSLVPVYYPNQSNLPQRPLITQLQVIDSSCSVKPKLFGNFQKKRDVYDSIRTTTLWVLFKAFRFPTSSRVTIQCDIQVCFDMCYTMKPCDKPYDARSGSTARKRRAVNETSSTKIALPAEVQTMSRVIEVIIFNDTNSMPMALINGRSSPAQVFLHRSDCLSSSTFYGVILSLSAALVILVGIVAFHIQRQIQK